MVSKPRVSTPVFHPAKAEDDGGGPSTSAVGAASFYAKPKAPTKKIVIGEKNSKEREAWGGALHDPSAEGAVVMPRPREEEIKHRGGIVNDVVIDPHLAGKMRDHQKKGVEVGACLWSFADSSSCTAASWVWRA